MADAPYLTLSLRRDLTAWKSRDLDGGKAGVKKVDLHTDYLTGRSVVLALASNKVDDDTKDAMAAKLKSFDPDYHVEMGKPEMPRVYDDSKLEDFVSEESWLFFKVRSSSL